MDSSQKTRILIGSLATAVVVLLVYALVARSGPAPKAPAGPASTPPQEQAAGQPAGPASALRIATDAAAVAGSTGHEARAVCDRALSCVWSITGGTFEGRAEGDIVTWTAGLGPETVLVCEGRDTDGQTSRAVFRVPLRVPGTLSRFEAQPPVITEGSSSRLQWVVTGVTGLRLDPGGQALNPANQASLEVKPEKTTTYTLTALDSGGGTSSRDVTVKVVPPPQILALRADQTVRGAREFTVLAEFAGGKAELKNGSAVLASGETGPRRVQVTDPPPGTEIQLTVTNEAGSYISSRLTFSREK